MMKTEGLDIPAPAVAISERRRVRRLWNFWERIRRERAFPAMRDIDPQRLPVEWNECFVLAAAAGEAAFEHVGAALALDCGLDPKGRPLSVVPADTLLAKSTGCVPEVLASRAPVIVEGKFQHADGHILLYRSIVMPFSDDGRTIDYLLGAATSRRVMASG